MNGYEGGNIRGRGSRRGRIPAMNSSRGAKNRGLDKCFSMAQGLEHPRMSS